MLVATSGTSTLELDAKILANVDTVAERADVFERCLSLLSRTAPATPGLQALAIAPMISSPTTAGLLSRSLLHHSTLTALTVTISPKQLSSSLTAPCVAAGVLPTLRHLTRLTSLTLSFIPKGRPRYPEDDLTPPVASPAVADILDILAEAVSALPHLARVHLDLFALGRLHNACARAARRATAHSCTAHKRRRLAGSPCDPAAVSLDPIVAALAAAPCISHLKLSSAEIGQGWSHCAGLRGEFPNLRQLELAVDHERAADAPAGLQPTEARAWPRPSAPIPAIRSMSLRLRDHHTHSNPEVVTLALSSCSHLPNLSTLTVELPRQTHEGLRRFVVGLRSAPQVATLRVDLVPTSHMPFSRCIIQGIAGSLVYMTGLTALKMSLPEHCSDQQALPPDPVPGTDLAEEGRAAATAEPLARLREMNLTFESISGVQAEVTTPCSFPLAPYSGLTSLTLLFNGAACKVGVLTQQQLPQLAALERLQAGPLHWESVASVEGCLFPLTKLTHVELKVQPVGAALVRCVARCAARMLRLATLELASCATEHVDGAEINRHAAADWVQGLRALPSWGTYSMRCHGQGTGSAQLSAVRQELADRGAHVSEDCCSIKF